MKTERSALVNEVISIAREELISKLGRAPKASEIAAYVPLAFTADAKRILKVR